MPNFRSGNFKQKNKKFKGKSSKLQNKFKVGNQKSDRVKKIDKEKNKKIIDCPQRIKRKNHRQNIQNNQIDPTQQRIDIIQNSPVLDDSFKKQLIDNISSIRNTKIILVYSLNNYDQNQLVNEINKFTLNTNKKNPVIPHSQIQYIFQEKIWNIEQCQQLKNKETFILIACPRDSEVFLDFCKISDVCVSITSVKYVDQLKLNKDPRNCLNAIDEQGEKFINLLNAQGVLNNINVVLDLDQIQNKKQKDVKFYFKRLLQESFPTGKVCFLENENEFKKFLVNLMNLKSTNQNWRNQRGYFLTDTIEIAPTGEIILSGYARNQFCLEELVHLTGFGDLQPQSFQTEFTVKRQNITRQFKVTQQHSTDMFGQNQNQNFEHQKDFEELQNLNKDFNDLNVELEQDEEMLGEDNQDEDISFNDENTIAEESKSRAQMRLQRRDEDELYFEDEVEYEADIQVREEFKEYKYMKSFIKNTWNIYDSLPNFYQNLFNFPNIQKTHNLALNSRKEFCFNGQYLRIQFSFNQELQQFLTQNFQRIPFIISSLLNHETKVAQCHFQLRFHNENEQDINSDQVYYIHQGFRKFNTSLIFSNIYNKSTKFKHVRKIKPQYTNWYLASFFNQIYYPNQNILVFQQDQNKQGKILMIGNNLYPDNFIVILKRIILTGYPLKSKKKTAVIRYMFFNPEDVDYYKQNEVYTKQGLKGKIRESLGTKGLMKCHFNGYVKQNDVVCMNLYKRVFPVLNYLINQFISQNYLNHTNIKNILMKTLNIIRFKLLV